MSSQGKLTVQCPECQAEIVIDVSTGEVLFHKKPRASNETRSHDFDTLLAGIDASKARADEVFDREFSALKDRERLMEEKFREALRRAEEEPDDKPPVRPWDLD